MRTGDGDAAAVAHQYREQLRAMQYANTSLLGGAQLRIGRPDRGRDDDRLGVAEVGGIVTDRDARSLDPQRREVGRLLHVRTRDAHAAREQHLRERAHPGSADADQVDRAELGDEGTLRLTHAAPPREK